MFLGGCTAAAAAHDLEKRLSKLRQVSRQLGQPEPVLGRVLLPSRAPVPQLCSFVTRVVHCHVLRSPLLSSA